VDTETTPKKSHDDKTTSNEKTCIFTSSQTVETPLMPTPLRTFGRRALSLNQNSEYETLQNLIKEPKTQAKQSVFQKQKLLNNKLSKYQNQDYFNSFRTYAVTQQMRSQAGS